MGKYTTDRQRSQGQANGNIFLDTALKVLDSGLSPGIPTEDGLKKPDGKWKRYQTTPATREEVIAWYRRGRTGNAIFTGYGNIEALEWDAKGELFEPFLEAAVALGIGDLVERIRSGYEEESPSGGIHWLYRCEEVAGNTKLAERPAPTEKDPNARQTLIETRGVGGFLVIAPSNGNVHPSGRPYKLRRGGIDSIATITPDEREALWLLAKSFDEIPAEPEPEPEPARPSAGSRREGIRPGTDFEVRARAKLPDIIEPFGWKKVYVRGGVEYWRRPGKEEGWSATWGKTKGFRVFTSSTSLEAKSNSLFYVYCMLVHRGNWTDCVKDLVQQGFGTFIDGQGQEHQNPPPERAVNSRQSVPPTASKNGVSGTGRNGTPPPVNGDICHHQARDDRSVIFVTTEEHEVNDQAVAALLADPSIFQRNLRLVSVARDSKPKNGDSSDIRRAEGTPIIRPIQAAKLREDLTRVARWQKNSKPDRDGKSKVIAAHPPTWSVNAILRVSSGRTSATSWESSRRRRSGPMAA